MSYQKREFAYKPSRKVYAFPAPSQPKCTIDSDRVHTYCKALWKENDMTKFQSLLATFKGVRKAIMGVGSDERTVIDEALLSEIEHTKIVGKDNHLPRQYQQSQRLPTKSTLFDSNIWYFIFRAMLPDGAVEVQDDTSFSILISIYENFLNTYISATYERYKNEADTKFNADLRRNHLKKMVESEQSKRLRVSSYVRSFGEYKTYKANILRNHYERLMLLITQPAASSEKALMWKMLCNLSYITSPETDAGIVNELTTKFFNEAHPNFVTKDCTKEVYDDWVLNYLPDINRHLTSSTSNIMQNDFGYIQRMTIAIENATYKSFREAPKMYKLIGLVSRNVDAEILSALNRISAPNFEIMKYVLDAYLAEDVVRVLFMNPPSSTYADVCVRLLKYLEVEQELCQKYFSLLNVEPKKQDGVECHNVEPLIAALFIYGYIDTIGILATTFTKVCLPEVLMCIYKNKSNIPPDRQARTNRDLLNRAIKLKDTLTGKYKYALMDIIDELAPSEAEPEPEPEPTSSNIYAELDGQ